MTKSLVLGDFGEGKCDKCEQNKDDLVSLTYGDDETTTDPVTYTFCTACIENAVGDAVNEGQDTQMLSSRAANE